jgi:hypothetical protein
MKQKLIISLSDVYGLGAKPSIYALDKSMTLKSPATLPRRNNWGCNTGQLEEDEDEEDDTRTNKQKQLDKEAWLKDNELGTT